MKIHACPRVFSPREPLCINPPRPAAPQPRKMLVFDFDGVLANSLDVTLEVIRDIARDQKVAPPTAQEYHGMTMAQLKRRLNVRFYQVPGLIRRGRAHVHKNRARMRTHAEVLPLLRWARARGLAMTILSSNSPPTIEAFLARNLPGMPFVEIIGNVGMYSKDRAIKRLMQRRRLHPHQLMYIGDEVRDIQAANAAGIRSAAVLWGKDTPEILRRAHPTHTATDGAELIRAVQASLRL